MATPRFKVKRQAYFKRGITTASTLDVDGAVNLNSTLTVDGDTTLSGSTTQTGALTTASTFTSGTSAIFGTGGTAIAGILCGSGNLVIGSIATSVTSATCFPVAGLTTSHKIFITGASLSGCVHAACARCATGTPACLVVTVFNHSSETVAGTSAVYYLAILDK